EDVVGAGDAEGLRRVGLDAGAVADDHGPDEALLGAGEHVGENRPARVLARPRGGVAQPSDTALSRLLDQAAALHAPGGVDPAAPRRRCRVEGARRPEAVRQAQRRPHREPIAFDDDEVAGALSRDVQARPATHRLLAAPRGESLDVEEDLETLRPLTT